jgi:hypothetical protein
MTEILVTLSNGAVTTDTLTPTAVSGDLVAASTGLYERTGLKDDAAAFTVTVTIPLSTFGRIEKKRPESVYVTASSLTAATLTVTLGSGVSYSYALETYNADDHTRRAKLGKGLKSNLLGFTLSTSQPVDFVIERIDIDLIPLSGRLL